MDLARRHTVPGQARPFPSPVPRSLGISKIPFAITLGILPDMPTVLFDITHALDATIRRMDKTAIH